MDFFWEMLSLQETLFLLILLGVLAKRKTILNIPIAKYKY